MSEIVQQPTNVFVASSISEENEVDEIDEEDEVDDIEDESDSPSAEEYIDKFFELTSIYRDWKKIGNITKLQGR